MTAYQSPAKGEGGRGENSFSLSPSATADIRDPRSASLPTSSSYLASVEARKCPNHTSYRELDIVSTFYF